mmetsp:Transcript_8713/g.14791  ORF Transcript_8713/g.14791 Transcript_8713/m.14791 type:complete len:658 (-) Transcript_8713:2439-4412(-)|eukprot:CAMPEP_0114416340 /NCGR_PEP_ID=MMETSP0103-20121206/2381_1 /TAXON_ID=37642 ORGANISM="Paraphysomonas imperforata, Strain PA2" /NCGR_SAMPLE_ID=MMETSP0103 /ASSEMBLY_ACC=CAM_ASM_000201 /LENGTH=657 /DNA_ID=CAMNT_0001584565 /DNA_START=170 /DNA_END=2143 /DNA_ORIENTATION=-
MSDSENNKAVTSPPPSPERVVPTDPVQLAAAVKTQVEYYFSKDNLKNDTFLMSKMDAQGTVAVSTILGFAKLKALTQDESVVLAALEGSAVVSVVDGRLKSAVKLGRNTIILREIPADTAEDDIREIFNYPGCKPISSIKSDIGDTWFVVMENEADAKDTVLDLKMKKRMFNGSSVKARLKSEAVVNRSHYPNNPPISNSVYPVMYPYGAGGGAGHVDVQQAQQFGYGGNQGSAENSPQARSDEGHNTGHGKSMRNDRDKRANGNNNKAGGREGGGSSNSRSNNDAGNRKGNNNSNSNNRNSRDGQKPSPRDTPVIEINSLNFPPLPPQGPGGEDGTPSHTPTSMHTNAIPYATISAGGSSSPSASTVTPTSPVVSAPSEDYSTIGYGDKPFMKYQIDDIINIVKNIKEAVLPDTIRTAEHPLAMEVGPNVDLLLRQRTFSIDETREQMQQGRPVQRDAVISGEVDYNSVMYGEDSSEGQGQGKDQATDQSPKKKTGGSWAGVLKSAASSSPEPVKTTPPRSTGPPAKTDTAKAKPEAGKKDGKKGAAGGRKDDKGKTGDKKDGRGGNNQRGSGGGRRNDQKEKEPAGPPLRWGDKPSFANVLKAKEEAPAQTQTVPRKQRSRSGSESSSGGKNQHPSAEDGTWSKQKLPPLKKNDP